MSDLMLILTPVGIVSNTTGRFIDHNINDRNWAGPAWQLSGRQDPKADIQERAPASRKRTSIQVLIYALRPAVPGSPQARPQSRERV